MDRRSSRVCKYFKNVGACALGDSCRYAHVIPMASCTVLVHNMYWTPDNIGPFFTPDRSDEEKRRHFERFYEEIFVEMSAEYGRILELAVAGNLSDHMVGNVWVRFESAFSAERAVKSINNRWFGGRLLYAELCTVQRVEEAECDQEICFYEPFCNYWHVLKPSSSLVKRLYKEQDAFESKEVTMERRRERNDGSYHLDRGDGPNRTKHGSVKLSRSPHEFYSH